MTTPLIRFEAERLRRSDNRKHIGEPGRCAKCGESCWPWSHCRPCRLTGYETAALYGPPLGEHFPSPLPAALPGVIAEPTVPWE